jgi:integrating conjugative element protein (TIGR03761 family)
MSSEVPVPSTDHLRQPTMPAADLQAAVLSSGSLRPGPAVAATGPGRAAASRLVAEEDTMELHTREAMLLYLGRSPDQQAARFGTSGARHAASALRQLFGLTARDNPYADLLLIDIDERVERIKQLILRTRKTQIQKLEAHKAMGLSYSIVRAQQTQTVSLGYHSPYGYMMSTVIAMFDDCVRVLKSAERRDLLTKHDQHEALYQIKHAIRSMFEAAIRGQRVLMAEQMKAMSRADFLPQNPDAEAAKRVEAAKRILGPLAEDVFTGKRIPRHSMRKDRLSDSEQRLLDEVAQSFSEPIKDAAATDEPAPGLI